MEKPRPQQEDGETPRSTDIAQLVNELFTGDPAFVDTRTKEDGGKEDHVLIDYDTDHGLGLVRSTPANPTEKTEVVIHGFYPFQWTSSGISHLSETIVVKTDGDVVKNTKHISYTPRPFGIGQDSHIDREVEEPLSRNDRNALVKRLSEGTPLNFVTYHRNRDSYSQE